jgi:hypothetical protein
MTPAAFAEKVRVADAIAAVAHARQRLELEALVGLRVGLRGLDSDRETRTYAIGSVAWRLHGALSLLTVVGSQVADPLRGTPEWTFASIGLRLAPRPRIEPRGSTGPVLLADRFAGDSVRITIGAPATARTVEVMGTMTSWEPVALERQAIGWTTVVRAPEAAHRVLVRVNGGDWQVPGNLTAAGDDFGRSSGILLIPR